jgi:hypothetical protein
MRGFTQDASVVAELMQAYEAAEKVIEIADNWNASDNWEVDTASYEHTSPDQPGVAPGTS